MIAEFNQLRTGYLGSTQWDALSEAERSSILSQAQARVAIINGEYARVGALAGVKNENFSNQTSPLGDQANLGYQVAALLVARNTVGSSANLQGGGPLGLSSSRVQGPYTIANFTEVVGMETEGSATSFVSNSGLQYGTRLEVPIEAQPYYRGNVVLSALTASISNGSVKLLVDNPGRNDFGDTHSLVLLVDSLTLMAAMEKLAPALTIADAKAIFAAAKTGWK